MASLPPLANPAQLAALTGKSASDSRLKAQLVEASRQFRAAVGHDVTRETRVLQLDGRGGRILLLPRPYPVLAPVDAEGETPAVVFEIRVDGDVVPAERYRVKWDNGIVTLRESWVWPAPPADITVALTAGYLPSIDSEDAAGSLVGLPEAIQAAVLEKAQMLLNVTPGVTQRSVLGDSVTFGSANVGATQLWSDAVAAHYESTGRRA